ncbi:MAG: protein kinase [Acidobacteria bacterium]|nr:protein kinase [Acidobacteriota bacterium]
MQLPARFGKYELEKFLGGGMSQVYRAKDTVLHRTVAVKILTDQGCRDEDAKKRFLAEAQMSAGFRHDNVITIHDFGEIEGHPFIVMEFLTGEDLRTAMDEQHTGDLKHRLGLSLQAARALAYVHTKNIIHRDIKPENLHVDENGRVRLMDFGIAKGHNLSLTKEGFALGTPYYMSPEQVTGKQVTCASDVYAFGIVLYELLTGLKPVAGETFESLFYQILHKQLDLAPLEQMGAPPALVKLIARYTAKQAEERPQSFDAVIPELERVIAGLEPKPAPVGVAATPAASKSILPYAAVAGALVVTAAVLAFVFLPSRKGEKKADIPVTKDIVKPVLPERLTSDFGEMVLVPEGKFLSGADNAEKTLPAFYLDRTEVSNGSWNKFRPEPTGKPNLPVVGVSFQDAADFCAYARKRLPRFDEWEKAARGPTGAIYPWGNEPDATRAAVQGNASAAGLQPVESLPNGATRGGALNLAGNVWEWVRDEGRKPNEMRVKQFAAFGFTAADAWTAVRGGSFLFDVDAAKSYEFMTVPAGFKDKDIGFRCAADPVK